MVNQLYSAGQKLKVKKNVHLGYFKMDYKNKRIRCFPSKSKRFYSHG